MNVVAYILDICFIASVIGMVYQSYRQGFLQAAVRTIGFLVAGIVAFAGSRILSEACYQLFFRDKLTATLETTVLNAANTDDFTEKMQLVIDSLPSLVRNVLASTGVGADTLAGQINNSAQQSAEQISAIVMDTVLHPLIVTMLNGICFLILFGAVMILVRSLMKILRGVRRIPLVGSLNALLGGAIGIVESAVVWYVIMIAIQFVLDISGGFTWLNREIIQSTWVFGRFYNLVLSTLPTISI